MSIFDEGNLMDCILANLQSSALLMRGDLADNYPKIVQERKKALSQIKGIVERHYDKKKGK